MHVRKADTDIDTKLVVLGICAHVTLFLLFSKCLIDVCDCMFISYMCFTYMCVYMYTHIRSLMCYSVCASSKLFPGVTKYIRNICSHV